jgi:hypothetical protein
LHFVVLSFDRYSRDDVIGEVMLDLEALDLSTSDSNPLPISREITPRSYKVNFIANLSNQPKFLTACFFVFFAVEEPRTWRDFGIIVLPACS